MFQIFGNIKAWHVAWAHPSQAALLMDFPFWFHLLMTMKNIWCSLLWGRILNCYWHFSIVSSHWPPSTSVWSRGLNLGLDTVHVTTQSFLGNEVVALGLKLCYVIPSDPGSLPTDRPEAWDHYCWGLHIGLAKTFVWMQDVTEIPEQNFWPTQCKILKAVSLKSCLDNEETDFGYHWFL